MPYNFELYDDSLDFIVFSNPAEINQTNHPTVSHLNKPPYPLQQGHKENHAKISY